jgi:uracil-DNA glycosylase
MSALSIWQSLAGFLDDAGLDVPPLPVARQAVTRKPDKASQGSQATRPLAANQADKAGPRAAPPPRPTAVRNAPPSWSDAAEEARKLALAATDLPSLKDAIERFEGCSLKKTARHTVVSEGVAQPLVLVIGQSPGQDEEAEGRPFAGRGGALFDKVLASIGIDRATNALLANVVFWRPPQGRAPRPEEIEPCRPFVERLITLAQPKLVLLVGDVAANTFIRNTPADEQSDTRRLSLTVGDREIAAVTTLLPSFLLNRPQDKARVWNDMLLIEARLTELGAVG